MTSTASGRSLPRRAMLALLPLLLPACTSIDTAARSDAVLVGVTRIRSSSDPLDARIRQIDVTALGAWQGGALAPSTGLGLLRAQVVELPADCRLVIRIPETWSVSQAASLLHQLRIDRSFACATTLDF